MVDHTTNRNKGMEATKTHTQTRTRTHREHAYLTGSGDTLVGSCTALEANSLRTRITFFRKNIGLNEGMKIGDERKSENITINKQVFQPAFVCAWLRGAGSPLHTHTHTHSLSLSLFLSFYRSRPLSISPSLPLPLSPSLPFPLPPYVYLHHCREELFFDCWEAMVALHAIVAVSAKAHQDPALTQADSILAFLL